MMFKICVNKRNNHDIIIALNIFFIVLIGARGGLGKSIQYLFHINSIF